MWRKILKIFRKKPPSDLFYLYLFIFWLVNTLSEHSTELLKAEAGKFLELPINLEMRLVLEEFIETIEWREGEQTAESIERFLAESRDGS